MATIDISRRHSLPLEEAKKRAEALANGMKDRFELVWQWEGDTLTFQAPKGSAKGTSGRVIVSTEQVRVQIDLPFLLRMLKGTIEQKVNEKLAALV